MSKVLADRRSAGRASDSKGQELLRVDLTRWKDRAWTNTRTGSTERYQSPSIDAVLRLTLAYCRRRHQGGCLLPGAAPLTRTLLQESLKRFIQGRLIRETATDCDVSEWKI